MKDLIINNALIQDPSSPYHGKKASIRIEKGVIKEIGDALQGEASFDANGMHLMQGLVDLRTRVQQPGEEFKEDLKSLNKAALAGGFTHLAIHPYNANSLQDSQAINFLRCAESEVYLLPIAACTKALEGKELTEMYDMKEHGAVGLSNGDNTIAHAGVMQTLLQYCANMDALLFSHAQLDEMCLNWQLAETPKNTQTGLKVLPYTAEAIQIQRDLALAEHNDARIHFSHVSSAKSVELIREAKKKGIKVSADVSIMHLLFSDEDLPAFDSNYKCNPPIRSKADQLALINGVKDGTINAICTDHFAQDEEAKNLEFEYAEFGIASLQWTFSKALELEIPLDTLLRSLTCNPACLLRLEDSSISESNTANFILFDPDEEWILNSENNASKSTYHPFMNQTLKGKVKAVYTKGAFIEV